ncbi:MAG: hypothetical protein OER12_04175 [Acidimicrobiia bacterium]|nr:hypothetical protein [Acidimicrobiia bacterium]
MTFILYGLLLAFLLVALPGIRQAGPSSFRHQHRNLRDRLS